MEMEKLRSKMEIKKEERKKKQQNKKRSIPLTLVWSGRQFEEGIFKRIFSTKYFWLLLQMKLKHKMLNW